MNPKQWPAFPYVCTVKGPAIDPIDGRKLEGGQESLHVFHGATLRDIFAGIAMQQLIIRLNPQVEIYRTAIAHSSYEMAEEMLKEKFRIEKEENEQTTI